MTILLAMSLPTDKAKAVVKLLLELGATSAQADMKHITALHYVVAHDNHDILDLLLSNDRPVALSVINSIGSSDYGNQGNSAIITAIEKGYQDMVSKLLSLGAKPNIDYDQWIKNYIASYVWAKNNCKEFHSDSCDISTSPVSVGKCSSIG